MGFPERRIVSDIWAGHSTKLLYFISINNCLHFEARVVNKARLFGILVMRETQLCVTYTRFY